MIRCFRFLRRPDVAQNRIRYLRRRLWFEFLRRFRAERLQVDQVVSFDRDVLMWIRLSDPIERSIYLYGAHEYRVVSVFSDLARPGMNVLDVGAHDGQYALLAAKRVGAAGRVLAVEPDPSRRARLLANVALNQAANISVAETALSDAAGEGLLLVPAQDALSGQASLRSGWTNDGLSTAVRVMTERLDDLLYRMSWNRLDIIKLDVEGLEAQVISGGRAAIRDHQPVIIFEVNDLAISDGRAQAPAIELLRELGYRIHGICMNRDGHVRLEELRGDADPRPYREPWLALNLVALPATGRTFTAAGQSVSGSSWL